MILIADSGSTKTTWMAVETGDKVVTEGLNPHFTSDEAFVAACIAVRKHFSLFTFHFSIHFYGAGCGSEVQRERVKRLLQSAFETKSVEVETDMLGACRAVCGHEAGLVGILGTGSNACFYDGEEIAHQAVSTGFILGDEGSANQVGRRLLQDYLTGVMPEEITAMFRDAYPQTREDFLDAVYHQPYANRFLASLARFAVEHIGDDYCASKILACLSEWYNYQLKGLRSSSSCDRLSLVGGFAAHIGPLLDRFAQDKGLVIKKMLSDPIDGLREYHRAKL